MEVLDSDYRKVNTATVSDSDPLPRMDDCVVNIDVALYIRKSDLLKGYWQVPLSPEASSRSAFITPDDVVWCTVMPFGVESVPITSQRLINTVVGDVPD